MRKRLICSLLALVIFFQPVFASDLPTGKDIKIAIIDTGISTKAINSSQIETGYNYVKKDTDTEDKIGHGTAIAGLIAGSASANLAGIAPKAKLVPLVYQTKDASGNVQKGNAGMVSQAIRDAVDIYGCRIINLSVGTTQESTLLRKAVEYAEKKNVVVVSSVGNKNANNPDSLYFPASYPTVIGVGSVNKKGRVSDFSQRNKSVMLVAMGERVWTVSTNGKALLTNGTSFSTAFVSAAAAALLSVRPELTAAEVRNILCKSATDILEPGYDIDSGWGILNVEKALSMALKD